MAYLGSAARTVAWQRTSGPRREADESPGHSASKKTCGRVQGETSARQEKCLAATDRVASSRTDGSRAKFSLKSTSICPVRVLGDWELSNHEDSLSGDVVVDPDDCASIHRNSCGCSKPPSYRCYGQSPSLQGRSGDNPFRRWAAFAVAKSSGNKSAPPSTSGGQADDLISAAPASPKCAAASTCART